MFHPFLKFYHNLQLVNRNILALFFVTNSFVSVIDHLLISRTCNINKVNHYLIVSLCFSVSTTWPWWNGPPPPSWPSTGWTEPRTSRYLHCVRPQREFAQRYAWVFCVFYYYVYCIYQWSYINWNMPTSFYRNMRMKVKDGCTDRWEYWHTCKMYLEFLIAALRICSGNVTGFVVFCKLDNFYVYQVIYIVFK